MHALECLTRRFVIRAAFRKELLMDTQTVIAVCEVLLVVIGIIGLALVRRE
ncbi:MAG: hypothetical protein IJC51_03440 [Eggerthellaceae bacterium]|nr:hypothetical protein [Eggerthellaceae bacterium]